MKITKSQLMEIIRKVLKEEEYNGDIRDAFAKYWAKNPLKFSNLDDTKHEAAVLNKPKYVKLLKPLKKIKMDDETPDSGISPTPYFFIAIVDGNQYLCATEGYGYIRYACRLV